MEQFPIKAIAENENYRRIEERITWALFSHWRNFVWAKICRGLIPAAQSMLTQLRRTTLPMRAALLKAFIVRVWQTDP